MLVVVSGLSIVDPRERPADAPERADALHRRFWTGCGRACRRATRRRRSISGLPGLAAPVGLPADPAQGPVGQRVPPALPGRVPALPAGPGVAGPARPAQADRRRARHDPQRRPGAAGPGAHRGPGRVAVPDRSRRRTRAGPADRWRSSPPTRSAGVPRGPRRPVRHQPRLQPGPDAAAAGGRRRAGRDQPALGAYGRRDHRRAGGGGRPAPAEAAVLRAALVRPQRVGAGVRDRQPARRADRGPAPGRLRQDQPGRGPGDLPALRAGRGAVADPAPLLRGQPGAAGRGGGAGGADPAPRPAGRRRDRPRLLRRPGAGGHRLRGALRRVVEAGPAAEPRPADDDLGRPDHRLVRGGPGRVPGNLAGGRPRAGAGLRVRAGPAGRRGDGAGAAVAAEPAGSRPRSAGRCPGCGWSWRPS